MIAVIVTSPRAARPRCSWATTWSRATERGSEVAHLELEIRKLHAEVSDLIVEGVLQRYIRRMDGTGTAAGLVCRTHRPL